MKQVVDMPLAVAGPAIHIMVNGVVLIILSAKRDPLGLGLIAINEAECGLPLFSFLRARVQAGQSQAVTHC